jgi:hypothetical protein
MEDVKKPTEARVGLIDLGISDKVKYNDAKELRFVLVNNGTGSAIVTSMKLAVMDCGLNTNLKTLQIAAPLQVYEYRLNLEPHVKEYQIISPLFTKKQTSFYLKAGDADSFLINLLSKEAYWYEFEVRVEWMDTSRSAVNTLRSHRLRVEYSILL